jgi:cytidylate kinase
MEVSDIAVFMLRKSVIMKITITLGRQLGCGGSHLGSVLAENLGFRCLDREIVGQTAKQYGIDEAELAAREERVSSFWQRMLTGFTIATPEVPYMEPPLQILSDQEIFANETVVMRSISEREDCVIVGRAAGYILPPRPGLINIFLHAPVKFRVRRLCELHDIESREKANEMLIESDAMRKRFIQQMTGRDWSNADNYHLSVDTSSLPMDEIALMLTDFTKRKIASLREA